MSKLIKGILGLYCISLCSLMGVCNTGENSHAFKKYTRFGLTGGLSLFEKSKVSSVYGNYTLDNKTSVGVRLGLTYSFIQKEKWSLSTGFIWATEPDMKFEFTLKPEDVYPGYGEDPYLVKSQLSTFSVPINIAYDWMIKERLYVNFNCGVLASYLPQYYSDVTVAISKEDYTEYRDIFDLTTNQEGNRFRASMVFGIGLSFANEKVLSRINLVYVRNFNPNITGVYKFDNLLVSPPSGGNYELSGNYIAIMYSGNFLKWKEK